MSGLIDRLRRGWQQRQLRDSEWRFLVDAPPPGEWVALDCETTGLNPRTDEIIAIGGDQRFQFQGVFTAAFGACIADAPALQHAGEQVFFLRRGGRGSNQAENAHLILRDLPQRRVGRRNNGEHFSQGHE